MSDLNVALILRFIDQATGPARAALRTVQGAAEGVERFGVAQVAAGRAMVDQSGAQIAALRGQALAVAGVGYAAYAMLRPAMQFEQAMARVGAVSGATAEEQALLTRAARDLGATTSFSARQAAEGMGYLAMAGFDVNQTITAMPGLLNLAAAAGADLGRTSDIASNILSGFALRADQMTRLGDVLTNTFTSSNTTLEMLGSTMSYVGPAAAAAGVGLEQAAAMAGLLGNYGIQGERAGTALRSMLSRLAAPSSEAAEALERLNLQVSDEGGNLRDIPTVLAEMDRAMQGMGSATRQELLTAIFGLEAATAAQVLMTEAGTGALQGYAAELRETGSAARVAEEMNATAQGAMRRLASAAEEAQIALGNGLLPVLADLAERLIPIITTAGQWIEANQDLVTSVAWVAAGLLGLNIATLAARAGFWLLFGWVGRLRAAFGLLLSVGGSVVAWAALLGRAVLPWLYSGVLVLYAGVLRLARVAFVALAAGARGAVVALAWLGRALLLAGRAVLLNPWVLAITAIAGGVYLIYRNWDGLVAWITDLASRTVAAISGIATEAAAAITAGASALWDAGAAMIQSLWDGAVARFTAFLEWVRGIPGAIIGAIGSIDLSGAIGFGSAPSGASSDPAERAAAAVRGQSLGYGAEATPSVGPRATGGPVRPLGWYRINEQGEELFSPAMAGRIIPAGQSRRLMAGAARAGASLQTGDIHVHAAPGMDIGALAREVRRQIEEVAREARFALHDGGLSDA